MATVIQRDSELDLHFPFAGVDQSDAFYQQNPREVISGLYARTCPLSSNVRGYAGADDQLKGGSRPGMVKSFTDRPGDTEFLLQNLATIRTGGTGVQLSNSGRVEILVGVSQGNVYYRYAGSPAWLPATNNAGGTPPLNFTGIMQDANLVQKKFFADGVNACYFDAVTLSVEDWVVTDGSFPADADNNFPRIIAYWRGRLLQTGVLKAPQSIFACAVDDYANFNYAPTDFTPTQAWAFTSGHLGQVGDMVTGLAPFNDDVCLIFCANEIQYLRGDPADGGKKDTITDKIGAAWGQAHCRDPYGTIFFVSNRMGIYAVKPGQLPQRVSQPIEQLVEAKDTGDLNIRLAYRDKDQSLNIFYTSLSEPTLADEHLVFELRTQSWHPVKFANPNHNPLAMCEFDGNETGDRELILGGWDGFCRQYDRDALTDDSTKINSFVWIGPLITATGDVIRLDEIQGVLGELSGDVDYSIYVGHTAEEAFGSEPIKTGTFKAGRNYTMPVRKSGHAVYVKLSSENRWMMEQIRARLTTRGMVARRGR